MNSFEKSDRRLARSHIVKVGDETIVQPPEEGRTHHVWRVTPAGVVEDPALPFVGQSVTVISHPARYMGRWSRLGYHQWHYRNYPEGAGFYPENLFRKVRTADGTEFVIHVDHLALADADEGERRYNELKHDKHGLFVPSGGRELPTRAFAPPATAFWEGDFVRRRPGASAVDADGKPRGFPERCSRGEGVGMVARLDFHLTMADGSDFCYLQSPDERPTFCVGDDVLEGYAEWSEDELELVERGNHWRVAHGQPPKFLSLEEEMFFAFHVDGTELVSPIYGNCKLAEARAKMLAIDQGHALAFGDNGGASWDHHAWWEVVRFKDAALAARASAAYPDGYVIPTSDFHERREFESRRWSESDGKYGSDDWPFFDK